MIQESNSSIRHNGLQNQPGLSWVKAIPVQAIATPDWFAVFNQTAPDAETIDYTTLTVLTGYAWNDIASDFPAPFIFTETEKTDSPQGHTFSYMLQQQISQNDLATRGEILRFYSRNEWVLVCQFTNGAMMLIGGPNGHGAKFKRTGTSGSHTRGTNLITLSFSWDSSEAALYIG